MQKYKAVMVTWADTSFFSGANLDEARDLKPVQFETLGFLIDKNKQQIIISGDISNDGHYRDINVIPTGCIVSVREMKLSKESK